MASNVSLTKVRTHDDGKFVRTALVLGDDSSGSIDVVNEKGERLALINLFTNDDGSWFALDVIDKDERYEKHSAIMFKDGDQQRIDNAGKMVAADFRMTKDF